MNYAANTKSELALRVFNEGMFHLYHERQFNRSIDDVGIDQENASDVYNPGECMENN